MNFKPICGVAIFLFPFFLFSQDHKIGDEPDGSLTPPPHIIKLIDEDSSVIRPKESPLLPFSTEKTCGACHNYRKISSGWHFNAGDTTSSDGRPGQPWIYHDAHSGTQLILSYRKWPHTFKPDQIGMNSLEFVTLFGRHMPGGGVGENEDLHTLDNYLRWRVSGMLEVNCLSCHNAEKTHNQAEFALQVRRQNFRWAATASSGLATVDGSAKDLPDNYTVYDIIDPDQSKSTAPHVIYNANIFNPKNEVFFDIERRVPSRNCTFCHSSKVITQNNAERWHNEMDVHMAAGMECVDCHRNGLDHNMVRGYETNRAQLKSLTCAGCHSPLTDDNNVPLNGRMGAPIPQHKGIPTIHFEELACTACHSGAWPGEISLFVKTSMGHELGVVGASRSDSALPHIATPVFISGRDGKIAPHNVVWPSWWGIKKDNRVQPIRLKLILPIARTIIGHVDSLATNNWPQLHDSTVVQVLDSLKVDSSISGQPVYISGGYMFYLNEKGRLTRTEDLAAEPYSWPIAHNVRPAAQSLGINGCADCHNPVTAEFTFGEIAKDSPLIRMAGSSIRMTTFLDQNIVYEKIFASSFYFRSVVKFVLFFCAFIIFAVLLIYLLRGISAVLDYLSSSKTKEDV